MANSQAGGVLGQIIGTGVLLEGLREPGGLFRNIALQQQLQSDPSFQQDASLFKAGLVGVGGHRVNAPVFNAAEEARAGLPPGQAQQVGVQVLGPGEAPTQSTYRPNFPMADPTKVFAQAIASLQNSVLGGADQPTLQKIGLAKLGVVNPDYEGMYQAAQNFGFVPSGMAFNNKGQPVPQFGPKPVYNAKAGAQVPEGVYRTHDVVQNPAAGAQDANKLLARITAARTFVEPLLQPSTDLRTGRPLTTSTGQPIRPIDALSQWPRALSVPGVGAFQSVYLRNLSRQPGPYSVPAQQLLSAMGGRSAVARLAGEVGNLNESEQQVVAEAFIPNGGDTPVSAENKARLFLQTLDRLEAAIRGGAQPDQLGGLLQAGAAAAASGGGDNFGAASPPSASAPAAAPAAAPPSAPPGMTTDDPRQQRINLLLLERQRLLGGGGKR